MADKNFQLVSQWSGYRHKTDVTNLPPGVLVVGSQNVLSTDGDTIKIREGYTLDGSTNATLAGIDSSYDWTNHLGFERNVRSYYNGVTRTTQYRYVAADGTVSWRTLSTVGSSALINFAEYWDDTEKIDVLLFVLGNANIYVWTGGLATFSSATVNTITLEGSTTWAELGFWTAGTRTVVIDGITYTYTGGEGTTTITGVTPDPTLGGHAVGAIIHQGVRTTANTPASSFTNNLIETLNNQVYVGSLTSRDVYKSKTNDYTDYTFSSPRLVGEGALLTLDASLVGFKVQEDQIYMTAGKNQWYQVVFQLSADLQNETLLVNRLKSNPQSAAVAQSAIGSIKNDVVFISNEPTFDTLGRVQEIATPQSVPLSDPIKLDFDALDVSQAHVKYHKNNVYIAFPQESKLYIYNLQKAFWEPPQILPTGRLAIIGDELYLHSNVVPETYKLFDGTSDNGNAIDAIAKFSYMNFGDRAWQKNFTEWYSEGYIAPNTTLTSTLNFDYKGFSQITSTDIEGDDTNIVLNSANGSLGKQSLGKQNLGGQGGDEFPKFRVINTFAKKDFYEIQPVYSSNDIDQRWELIAFGPAAGKSTSDNNFIKRS